MANVFTLTDGTTTISLNAGSYLTTSYKMATPDSRDPDHATETLEVLISGASLSAIQTNVRAVELLLEAAKRRFTNQSGPRIFFTVQWDGEGSAWRAEVTDGRLETEEAPDQLRRGRVETALILTRGPFEGDEVQLTLTNANGTNNTAGLVIWNHNDGGAGHDNWASIDAAEVGGTLPAPVRVRFVSNISGSRYWRGWWISTNPYTDQANFTHVIEGEDRVTGYGTITANATCSGGNYNSLSVTTSGQMQWDISAADVARAGGHPFRILARFHGSNNNLNYAQACIYDATGFVELLSGDLVQSDTYGVMDLGVLRIPPDVYATGYGAVRLILKLYVTGTKTITLDYIQLMPADTTRMMVQRGMTHVLNTENGFDESEGRAYGGTAAAGTPIYIMKGAPLLLEPGKTQRLYLLVTDSTGGSDIADNWTMQAWYRPRRWSV
jgi:hypothetical protein